MYHHRQQQQTDDNNNNSAPNLLSMNQTHFFPPQTRLSSHHYGDASSSAFFPVDFKLGLNNNDTTNYNDDNYYKQDCNNCVSINEDARISCLVRGSEQYEVLPEARPYTSLGMHHSWQNQQDYAPIKQQPFWEPLPSEVSNENSEIVDRQEHLEMSQKEALTNCLESKSRLHFSELEAIYKRMSTSVSNQTRPPIDPVNIEANSTGEEATKKRKKKKRYNAMAEFIENLVKQVINHQDNLHTKYTEVIERLDLERREREEAWRNQELEHFEKEAKERAHERFLAKNREAIIVSYLEKITGQNINLPTLFRPSEINTSNISDDFDHGDE